MPKEISGDLSMTPGRPAESKRRDYREQNLDMGIIKTHQITLQGVRDSNIVLRPFCDLRHLPYSL